MKKGLPRKENHWREYLIAFLGVAGEYAALRYGLSWLAWLAAFLLWLGVLEFTSRWASTRRWLYVMWVVLFLAMGLSTYYLTRPKPVPIVAQANQPPSQNTQPLPTPKSTPSKPEPIHSTVPKKKTPAVPSGEDNSTYIESGAGVNQNSSGNCSPNIVGGKNTVNCPQPPPTPMGGITAKGAQGDLISGNVVIGSMQANLDNSGSTQFTNNVLVRPDPNPTLKDFTLPPTKVGETFSQILRLEYDGTLPTTMGTCELYGEDSADFSFDNSRCTEGTPLKHQDTCVVLITFAPKSKGEKRAIFSSQFVGGKPSPITLHGTTKNGD